MELQFDHRVFLLKVTEIIDFLLKGVFKHINVKMSSQFFPSCVEIHIEYESFGENISKRVTILNRIGSVYWLFPDTIKRYNPQTILTKYFMINTLFPSIQKNLSDQFNSTASYIFKRNADITIEKFFNPEKYAEMENQKKIADKELFERMKKCEIEMNIKREDDRLIRAQNIQLSGKYGVENEWTNKMIRLMVEKTKLGKWIPQSEHHCGFMCSKNSSLSTECCCCENSGYHDHEVDIDKTLNYAKGIYHYSDTGLWIFKDNNSIEEHDAICDDCHDRIILIINKKIF